MAKHILIDWEFDMQAWSKAIALGIETIGYKDLAALLDLDPSTLSNWKNTLVHEKFPHPSMSNFVKVCNLLDLDPRDFWRLVK